MTYYPAGSAVAAAAVVDVPMTANTFADACSVELSAGKWEVSGTANVINSGGHCVAKLWDGTTAYASASSYNSTPNGGVTLSIPTRVIILPATTTVKLSVASDAIGGNIKAAPAVLATGLAGTLSRIDAVKIP